MKTTILTSFFITTVIFSVSAAANMSDPSVLRHEDTLKKRLVKEIEALDSVIERVRPARVREPSHPKFKLYWTPAVYLKKGTSLEKQIAVTKKVVSYVLKFQGGVKTKKVYGGLIMFLEGDGWNPEIGTATYDIESRAPLKMPVTANRRTTSKTGAVSCCEKGDLIGTIADGVFKAN
jgi:hypothetical protein